MVDLQFQGLAEFGDFPCGDGSKSIKTRAGQNEDGPSIPNLLNHEGDDVDSLIMHNYIYIYFKGSTSPTPVKQLLHYYIWGNKHPAIPAILGYHLGASVLTHNHFNALTRHRETQRD